MSEQKLAVVVVCAKETNPPFTGSKNGYECKCCKTKVQATMATARKIDGGEVMFVLCNQCGFKIHKMLKESRTDLITGFTPEFMTQAILMLQNQHDNN